jgi:hypothetical protein
MMLFSFLLIQANLVADLDALAKARDVAALTKYLIEVPHHNPFKLLETGGAYAVGAMGWRAVPLDPPGSADHYLVLSTPTICEDAGELLFKVENGKLRYLPERDSLGLILEHHSLDVRFDLPKGQVFVQDVLSCGATTSRPYYFFRMSPTFHVRSIQDERHTPVPYSQGGGIVAFKPRKALRQLTIGYDGTVEKPAFNQVISPREATLAGSVWYPMAARRPTSYDVTMHIPKDWTAIAQGDAVSSELHGTERISSFQMKVPVVWFSTSAGPFRIETMSSGGREYSTASASMTPEQMQIQNTFNKDVVEFYSKNFGAYPFKRWTAVDSRQFAGGPGALEAYSHATYPGGLPTQDAHEPSHTWWGGILNNDYLKSLWNESFANYSMGLFQRQQPLGKQAELDHAYVQESFYAPMFEVAPLSDSGVEIGPPAAGLGYGKGALVLQVLEDELGAQTMMATMHRWIQTNPQRHIGSWEDYESVVRQVTGRDYGWFFDQWVRGVGMPDFTLESAEWNSGFLRGHLALKGAPYILHPEVLLQFADGSRSFMRVSEVNRGDFVLHTAKKPTLISIDPWQRIPRVAPGADDTTRLATLGEDHKVYVDPAHKEFLPRLQQGNVVAAIPADLSSTLIIGSPESTPAMQPLCKKVGFSVSGHNLTFDGTTIDLRRGGALAMVDLPNGSHCAIGLGTFKVHPDFGKARLLVFDDLGRTLRARTDPMTKGSLAREVR